MCIYVKNSIYCHPLNDFYNEDFEVHWSLLRPCRLPRGISNVIVAVVYHPPNPDNSSMMEYLRESLEIIEHTYPNSATIIAGDFNKLDFKLCGRTFQLKPGIGFPTRGLNTLDQIFSDLLEYYAPPISLPPFGLYETCLSNKV